ncbi:MAG: aminoacyl-tRNA hydrolase [Bacilli bacterium]
MKLIVGLGNPGKEYERTRHNIGFMVIDNYANKKDILMNKIKFNGVYGEIKEKNEKIILLKPQLYINLSGDVIKKYIDFFKIKIEDILIINDDLDLEVGKYKLKENGSSAGHNGLKNIEINLQTSAYKRLKIGISNNKTISTKDYVLGNINEDEIKQIKPVIDLTFDIINDFIENSFELLMNKYNHR